MFSSKFTHRTKSPVVDEEKCHQLLPHFRRIVIPSFGAPYSQRSLLTACRMVGEEDAEIKLVYFIEVPRAYSLAASMPGEEAMANSVLDDGLRSINLLGCSATSEVQRGRDLTETLLRYVVQHDADLVVLGARSDSLRGIPLPLTRELYDRCPCPVILDYIAGETPSQEEPVAA
jgi:nucleotide-binding universal stress UspA family protein